MVLNEIVFSSLCLLIEWFINYVSTYFILMISLNLVALLIICLTLRSFLLRLSDPQKVENVLYKPMKRIRIKKSDHRVVYLAFLLTFLYILNKLETHNQIISRKFCLKNCIVIKWLKRFSIKFMFSKKATQNDEIFNIDLTFTT